MADSFNKQLIKLRIKDYFGIHNNNNNSNVNRKKTLHFDIKSESMNKS